MNDISAAIARGNLSEWDAILQHRTAINAVYAEIGTNKGYIEGIWNPQVVGINPGDVSSGKYGFEIGQYHYPNSKYSLFARAENNCPKMDELKNLYFMLPCHMGMTLPDAARIANIIWR